MVDKRKGELPIDPLLRASQVSKILDCSEKLVYKLAATDPRFPKPKRIGGRLLRWSWAEVAKYIESTG